MSKLHIVFLASALAVTAGTALAEGEVTTSFSTDTANGSGGIISAGSFDTSINSGADTATPVSTGNNSTAMSPDERDEAKAATAKAEEEKKAACADAKAEAEKTGTQTAEKKADKECGVDYMLVGDPSKSGDPAKDQGSKLTETQQALFDPHMATDNNGKLAGQDETNINVLKVKQQSFEEASAKAPIIGELASKGNMDEFDKVADNSKYYQLSGGNASAGLDGASATPVSFQKLNAVDAQAIRDGMGKATVVIGGTGDGITPGVAINGKNKATMNLNDDSLVYTDTETARGMRLSTEPLSLTQKDGELTTGLAVPAGTKVNGSQMTSAQLEMATYIDSQAKAAGMSDTARQTLLTKVGIESGYNTFAAAQSSSASGLGQYIKSTWRDVGVTDASGNVMNRNNTDAQIATLINETQSREDTYNSSASLQARYSTFGEYDYAIHHDGNALGSENSASHSYALNEVYNPHVSQGANTFALTEAALSGQSTGQVIATNTTTPTKGSGTPSSGSGTYASNGGGNTGGGANVGIGTTVANAGTTIATNLVNSYLGLNGSGTGTSTGTTSSLGNLLSSLMGGSTATSSGNTGTTAGGGTASSGSSTSDGTAWGYDQLVNGTVSGCASTAIVEQVTESTAADGTKTTTSTKTTECRDSSIPTS